MICCGLFWAKNNNNLQCVVKEKQKYNNSYCSSKIGYQHTVVTCVKRTFISYEFSKEVWIMMTMVSNKK